MKRFSTYGVFTLLILLTFIFPMSAQQIEGNKLISWASATGAIVIPANVTEIAENCFYTPEDDSDGWGNGSAESNTNITSIDFNNVKIIGKNAFRGCSNIASIKALNVTTIAEDAFRDCTSLKKINLPVIVTLGKQSFANCEDLNDVALGQTLANVDENPFVNCQQLSSLKVDVASTTFKTENNALIRIADGVLISVGGKVTELVLGAECKEIGISAMYGCSRLTKVSLPAVTKLGDKSLVNCNSLSELLLPKLEEVDNSSFITMQGVGNLRVVDIHLSNNFQGFNGALPDNSATKVYVANQTIKTDLEKVFNKIKVIVGSPSAMEKFIINYSCNSDGSLDVWTTGATPIVTGQSVSSGSKVTFKALPHFDHEVESWILNGNNITSSVQNNIYVIESVEENINLVVTFRKKSEGHYIFFRSKQENFGSLRCTTSEGVEINSGEKVPVNSTLTFGATPRKGFRITEWYKEQGQGTSTQYVVIPGQTGLPSYSTPSEDGLDISVDFDRMPNYFIVKYLSYNIPNGTLTAALADGTAVVSGEAFVQGTKIIFTVHPTGTNTVEEWQLNGQIIKDYKNLTYTIESLSSDVEIGVLCSSSVAPGTLPTIRNGHLISWKPIGNAVLPDEVTHIDSEAFSGATQMTSLKLNNNLQYIGERSFLYTTNITHFEVPTENTHFVAVDGVLYNKEKTMLIAYPAGRTNPSYEIIATAKSILPGCFVTCPHLQGVTVANGNTSLSASKGALFSANGETLFFYPTGVSEATSEVRIPEGTKTIARLALSYYPAVKKLFLPSTLKTIEQRALSYNPLLTSIEFDEGVTSQIEVIGDSAFYYSRQLLAFPYMSQLKTIGKGAFGVNSLLEEIHIPLGCAIGEKAFKGCQSIKRVYAYDTTPAIIEADAFSDIVYINEAVLNVPIGAKQRYLQAVGWSIFGNNIVESSTLDNQQVFKKEPIIRFTSEGFLVEGLKPGLRYTLYTSDGKSVLNGIVKENTIFIQTEKENNILFLSIEGFNTIKLMY